MLTVAAGTLYIKRLKLPYLQKAERVLCDGKEIPFSLRGGELTFSAEVKGSLTVI